MKALAPLASLVSGSVIGSFVLLPALFCHLCLLKMSFATIILLKEPSESCSTDHDHYNQPRLRAPAPTRRGDRRCCPACRLMLPPRRVAAQRRSVNIILGVTGEVGVFYRCCCESRVFNQLQRVSSCHRKAPQ